MAFSTLDRNEPLGRTHDRQVAGFLRERDLVGGSAEFDAVAEELRKFPADAFSEMGQACLLTDVQKCTKRSKSKCRRC